MEDNRHRDKNQRKDQENSWEIMPQVNKSLRVLDQYLSSVFPFESDRKEWIGQQSFPGLRFTFFLRVNL